VLEKGKNMLRFTVAHCLLIIVGLSICPSGAQAIPTINCHCFRDRSYDPARPTAADAYLLATTQNSFFATIFGIEQREIVMKKQTGTPADDLWVAYWVAARSGISSAVLLSARRKKASWNDVIFPLNLPQASLGTPFLRELGANATDARLAETVADELLVNFRLLDRTALASMRKQHATNQELIMATLIAAKSGQPADRLLLAVRGKRTSWGELLRNARIESAKIKAELASLLIKSRVRTSS
jgi:hypothetical protein